MLKKLNVKQDIVVSLSCNLYSYKAEGYFLTSPVLQQPVKSKLFFPPCTSLKSFLQQLRQYACSCCFHVSNALTKCPEHFKVVVRGEKRLLMH